MDTISAILVDDEQNSRIVLKNLLADHPEIEIIGEASDIETAYTLINKLSPQLVFLDIQMPGGNGFSLLKRWEEIPFEVIFVTSYDSYAINAIKFSALDYLLKPIGLNELKSAVEKAVKSIKFKVEKNVQIINLLNNIDNENQNRKIIVHANDKVKLLTVDKICYIEADNNYSHIIMGNGERYTTPKVLKDFEEFLTGNTDFIRIHKSNIINVQFINDYSKGEPCMVTMEGGKIFEVARRKKQEVLERLKKGEK